MRFDTLSSPLIWLTAGLLLCPALAAQEANSPPAELPFDEAAPLETEAAKKPTLLIFQFKGGAVKETVVRATMDFTAGAFARTERFDLMTMDDVQTLLELEATKHSIGCDDAGCMAEIAGAVGADYVVSGEINKLGKLYAINVSVLDPAEAKIVGLETVKARELEAIPSLMDRAALRLTHRTFGEAIPDELKPRKRKRRREDRRRGSEPDDGEPSLFGTILLWGGAAFALVGTVAFAAGLVVSVASFATVFNASSPGIAKLYGRYGTTVGVNTVLFAVPVVILSGGVAGLGWLLE